MNLPFLTKPGIKPIQKAAPAAPQAKKGAKPAAAPPPVQSSKAIAALESGLTSIVDLIAPSSVEVDFRYIRVGDNYYTTLFVAGYPRYVSPGWLSSIIDYDHTMDIAKIGRASCRERV